MANIIKPKRSNTAAKVPNTTELTSGELGVNMADRKVYINNGTAVVQVGAGNLSGLGDVAIATPANGQALTYNSTTSKWENSSASTGTVTSVSGTGTASGLSLSGTVTTSGNLTLSGTVNSLAAGTYAISISGNAATATNVAYSGLTGTVPTWNQSTTGNAATASNASLLNSISAVNLYNNMGDAHSTRTSFDATTPSYGFGYRFVQGNTNGPATGATQYYSWYIGLGSEYPATGAGSYGAMFAVDRNSTTPYLSVRYNENNSFSAWQKIRAGYADTSGNVTGTVAVANGGTGSTTAAGALTNLGAYAASNPSGYITTAGARSAVSFTAGSGAYNSTTGVFTIPTNTNQLTNGAGFVTSSGVTSVATGTGLSGGTITTTGTISLANTAVTPGSYTLSNITVDAQGRITAASSGTAPSGFVAGMILLWSGSIATIPSGWVICDGLNSTPNLRDRFVVGAGTTYAVNATGGATTATLAVANLPSHTHTFSGTGTSGNASGTGSTGSISTDFLANFGCISNVPNASGAFGTSTSRGNRPQGTAGTGSNTNLTLNIQAHTHSTTISGTTGGGSGTSTAFSILPPYYALAYIMKT